MLESLRYISTGSPGRLSKRGLVNAYSELFLKQRMDNGGLLSPLIAEASPRHKRQELHENKKADIVIIGGGIAGMLTAYFLLQKTNLSIVVCEAGVIANGATGNNAEHATPTSETTFRDKYNAAGSITDEPRRRLQLARDAEMEAVHGFLLLQQIIKNTPGLDSSVPVTSYDAIEQHKIQEALDDLLLKRENGIIYQRMLLDESFKETYSLRRGKYRDVSDSIPSNILRQILRTQGNIFPAASASQATIINGVRICDVLALYLSSKYEDRFNLYENTPVSQVNIDDNGVIAQTNDYIIDASKAIFCTNGYNTATINHLVNPNNNHLLDGQEKNFGAVVVYLVPNPGNLANCYMTDPINYPFITQRNITLDGGTYGLVFVGGPTQPSVNFGDLPQKAAEIMQGDITNFIQSTLDSGIQTDLQYPPFRYVGKMSYSKKRLRLIGPVDDWLYFNTGCNGIGLALSAAGAERIAERIAEEISGVRHEERPSLYNPLGTQFVFP